MSPKISKNDKTKTEKINKPKRSNRKWSFQENILILEYLLDTVQSGYEIEKPTSVLFYKGLIEKTKMVAATPLLIKNKVRNHRSTYLKALEWEKRTGQGVIDADGEVTFKAVLLKRYPYIDWYRQIWGGRKNVIPPSTSQVTQIGRPAHAVTRDQVERREDQSLIDQEELPSISEVAQNHDDSGCTEQVEQQLLIEQDEILSSAIHPIDAQDDDLIQDGVELIQDSYELLQDGDEFIQDSVDLIHDNDDLVQDSVELIQDGNASLIQNCDEPVNNAENNDNSGNLNIFFKDGGVDYEEDVPTTTKPITPSIAQAGKKLVDAVSKGKDNSDVNSSKGAYDNIMKMRVENSDKKFDLEFEKFNEEHEKFEFEQFKFQKDQQYRDQQLNMEFEFKQKELDFKKTQEENRNKLRLEELEVEKLKWKALLAKYQSDAENK